MAKFLTLDARGAEQTTETGVGFIESLEPKGPRNVQVRFKSDTLRLPVLGWADREGPAWSLIEAAAADKRKVWYRIDVHRKDAVDPTVPIAAVDKFEKVRDLVSVTLPEHAQTEAAIKAGSAPTSPPAAPAAAPTSVPSTQPAPAPQNAESGETAGGIIERAKELVGAVARPGDTDADSCLRAIAVAVRDGESRVAGFLIDHAELSLGVAGKSVQDALAWGRRARVERELSSPSAAAAEALGRQRDPDRTGERAPSAQIPRESDPTPQGVATTAARGPAVSPVSGLSSRRVTIASDGKPWEATNSDGRINLGSYAAGAVVELTNLAARLMMNRARQVHEDDPSKPINPPAEPQVHGLAVTLVTLADRIQVAARGGRVDRMGASHRVARQALREGLDLYPIPWRGSDEDVTAWQDAVLGHGTMLVRVASAVLAGDYTPAGEPDAPPAEPSAEG